MRAYPCPICGGIQQEEYGVGTVSQHDARFHRLYDALDKLIQAVAVLQDPKATPKEFDEVLEDARSALEEPT